MEEYIFVFVVSGCDLVLLGVVAGLCNDVGVGPAVEEDFALGEFLVAVGFEDDFSSDGVFEGEDAIGRRVEND